MELVYHFERSSGGHSLTQGMRKLYENVVKVCSETNRDSTSDKNVDIPVKYSDVVFLVGSPSVKIRAHRLVLSLTSPVFEQMFFGTTANPCVAQFSPEIEHVYQDVNVKTFKQLLEFAYCGEVTNLAKEDLPDLAMAANQFAFEDLADFCESTILSINPINIINDPTIDKLFGAQIQQFILKNAEKILQSDQFLNINHENLYTLLNSDDLNCEETTVYTSAIKWAEQQCLRQKMKRSGKNLRTVLGDCRLLIRYPLLPPKFFNTKVDREHGCILDKGEIEEIYRYYLINKPPNEQISCIKRMSSISFDGLDDLSTTPNLERILGKLGSNEPSASPPGPEDTSNSFNQKRFKKSLTHTSKETTANSNDNDTKLSEKFITGNEEQNNKNNGATIAGSSAEKKENEDPRNTVGIDSKITPLMPVEELNSDDFFVNSLPPRPRLSENNSKSNLKRELMGQNSPLTPIKKIRISTPSKSGKKEVKKIPLELLEATCISFTDDQKWLRVMDGASVKYTDIIESMEYFPKISSFIANNVELIECRDLDMYRDKFKKACLPDLTTFVLKINLKKTRKIKHKISCLQKLNPEEYFFFICDLDIDNKFMKQLLSMEKIKLQLLGSTLLDYSKAKNKLTVGFTSRMKSILDHVQEGCVNDLAIGYGVVWPFQHSRNTQLRERDVIPEEEFPCFPYKDLRSLTIAKCENNPAFTCTLSSQNSSPSHSQSQSISSQVTVDGKGNRMSAFRMLDFCTNLTSLTLYFSDLSKRISFTDNPKCRINLKNLKISNATLLIKPEFPFPSLETLVLHNVSWDQEIGSIPKMFPNLIKGIFGGPYSKPDGQMLKQLMEIKSLRCIELWYFVDFNEDKNTELLHNVFMYIPTDVQHFRLQKFEDRDAWKYTRLNPLELDKTLFDHFQLSRFFDSISDEQEFKSNLK